MARSTRPWRVSAAPCRRASSATQRAPTLCRVSPYCAPGFPRPTTSAGNRSPTARPESSARPPGASAADAPGGEAAADARPELRWRKNAANRRGMTRSSAGRLSRATARRSAAMGRRPPVDESEHRQRGRRLRSASGVERRRGIGARRRPDGLIAIAAVRADGHPRVPGPEVRTWTGICCRWRMDAPMLRPRRAMRHRGSSSRGRVG